MAIGHKQAHMDVYDMTDIPVILVIFKQNTPYPDSSPSKPQISMKNATRSLTDSTSYTTVIRMHFNAETILLFHYPLIIK